jgi:hypothetical protein
MKKLAETNTKFEHWALVELMGHQRVAGRVTEESVAGKSFLRVDVPDAKGETVCTRYYSPEAVYCISPTDRQIAIGLAAKTAVRPVTIYDLARMGEDKKIGEGEESVTADALEE